METFENSCSKKRQEYSKRVCRHVIAHMGRSVVDMLVYENDLNISWLDERVLKAFLEAQAFWLWEEKEKKSSNCGELLFLCIFIYILTLKSLDERI